jgi:hypothetical protein
MESGREREGHLLRTSHGSMLGNTAFSRFSQSSLVPFDDPATWADLFGEDSADVSCSEMTCALGS